MRLRQPKLNLFLLYKLNENFLDLLTITPIKMLTKKNIAYTRLNSLS